MKSNGEIIYQDKAESFKALVEAAVKTATDLRYADLRYADLRSADLGSANLRSADLGDADLGSANLRSANLRSADLRDAVGLDGFYSFGPGGSRNSSSWARWEDGGYKVHCGCADLTLDDFKKEVIKTHKETYHAKYYLAQIEIMQMIADESKAAWEARKK